MKLSHLFLLAVVAVVGFFLFQPRLNHFLNQGPVAAENFTPASTISPSPEAPLPDVATPPARALPEVDAASLTRIRGKIVRTVPGGVVVDCNARPPIEYSLTVTNYGAATDGKANLKALSDLTSSDADRRYFGSPRMFVQGQLEETKIIPKSTGSGLVILAGYTDKVGRTVHLVASPTTKREEKLPVYLARFRLKSNAWMRHRD